MPERNLTRVYSDRTYVYTTMVRHQGTTVAFAMDDQRRIYYSVLNLSSGADARTELDVAYWQENPVELRFPNEITQVGYAAAGATRMPVVKRGGRVEAGTEPLGPGEVDHFLSTTARLSAPVPFQVLSDGTYVVVFRQAVDAVHLDAVFELADGGASGNPDRADYVFQAGARVPVVDATLLCDRFVLVGAELQSVMEARYRRSRHKTRPASSQDTLGTQDMEGLPFVEPTQELSFVRRLTEGAFAVLLLPTMVDGVRRWQVFARNNRTGRVDSFNIEQGGDVLFNTQGTRYFTSPDPAYADAVFERSPGVCPFTGKDLVPVVSTTGHAETALRFDGQGGYVDLGSPSVLQLSGKAYTIEAWIRPAAAQAAPGGAIVAKFNQGVQGDFFLLLDPAGKLVLGQNGSTGSATSTRPVAVGRHTHVAAVVDAAGQARLYLDGDPAGEGVLGFTPDGTTPVLIAAEFRNGQPGDFFHGDVDEVRLWNRAREHGELARDRSVRLVGNEPGLVAFYRFDEGAGTVLYDQTDSALHGTVKGQPAPGGSPRMPLSATTRGCAGTVSPSPAAPWSRGRPPPCTTSRRMRRPGTAARANR
jgi:hypothetical protein